jgi:REP element-mobilizing transposase RayT
MSRPLRIEYPGAIYHVTSRGDRRGPVYRDDEDRVAQIEVIARAMDRFDAQVLAYCQMGNHFHLVLHTRRANLSRLMRHVNGVYTQTFNRRHGLAGHLFQGRFKAILVDREAYLLALCRHVERNPVAAGLVARAEAWPWSSCRAHVGLAATPPWLDTDGLHGYLLGRPVGGARDRQRAVQRYTAVLAEAPSEPLWESGLRRQMFLGDEDFVARMQALAAPARRAAVEVPRAQCKSGGTLQDCLKRCADRPQALRMAYRDCGISMTALARELDLSVSHISRLIAGAERGRNGKGRS